MTQPSHLTRTGPARPEEHGAAAADTSVDSAELMNGKRELLIRHGEETYRLRVTASNKLILTK